MAVTTTLNSWQRYNAMNTYRLSPKQYGMKILHLSQHMLVMSYKQDWRACMKLEEQRQNVINDLFTHHEMPGALEDIADIIEKVLSIDSESLYICEEARNNELKSINKAKTGFKAVVSYLSSS